jgi:23S rRNA pseudouridine1911/1915/1917 synthase
VRRVGLLDVDGHTQEVPLLHCGTLLKLAERVNREEALAALEEVARLVAAADISVTKTSITESGSHDSGVTTTCSSSSSSSERCVLYVKDDSSDAAAEVLHRQRRFVAKLRGRLLSPDPHAVEEALKRWLAATSATGALHDEDAVAEYRGMVEALAMTDATAAVALAINPTLPSLTAGASAALAALVQLNASTAVHAFLESFAEKDEMSLACETSATHLALRLRKELTHSDSSTTTAPTAAASDTTARLLKEAMHFNVDPGVVFPAEPAAIQAWAENFLTPTMLPLQRSTALLQQIQRRRLQPRRVSMDALSVWALSDLERPWLKFALQPQMRNTCTPRESGTRCSREADEVLYNVAYQLALKDPKRNLIDNRLLHTYAAALARGDLSALDSSFPAFVEECGECHSDGNVERPTTISFTLPPLPSDVPLLRALHDLAPQCSYWRTLLSHHAATHVRAFTAPLQEVKVEVRLPATHECVATAQSGRVPLPSVPVLYEDADVIVVDKPAGLATSRHGLSCTQVGAPTLDLISVLLSSSLRGVEGRSCVFRQGQVHRLDAETSGCLLIAKTDVAADSLRHQMGTSAAFSHQSKVYYALCVVLEPSLRSVKLHDEVIDAADPKVRTRYRVIRFYPTHRMAWVECRIQQGKKHQIRRHLASRGIPILADVEHGGAACCQSMMDRVALHARSVSFIHPVSAEPLVVVAPLPEDFRRCLAQLQTS